MATTSAAAKKSGASAEIEALAGEIVGALRYRFGKDRSVATPAIG
jgi:hypothetical protein